MPGGGGGGGGGGAGPWLCLGFGLKVLDEHPKSNRFPSLCTKVPKSDRPPQVFHSIRLHKQFRRALI